MKYSLMIALIVATAVIAGPFEGCIKAIPIGIARLVKKDTPSVAEVREQPISASYNVKNPAVIQSSVLDRVLGGVLKGKGRFIMSECRRAGICPVFVAAVLTHESDNGKSKFAKEKNNVAGIYDGKNKRYRSFGSVDQSITFTVNLLAGKLYAGGKRKSIKSIQQLYCPVGASNDPKGINCHWLGGVQEWMQRLSGQQTLYCKL
jgi:hypothetical protein